MRIPSRYILAATHVTSTVPPTSRASDGITSSAVRLPTAHRTGIAIGAVKGISDSATAYVEPGLFDNANTDRYAIMSRNITGCCACRASCSLDEMAPTAANIADYRKKPPRKHVRNTTIVAAVMFGNWHAGCWSVASGGARLPTRVPARERAPR